MLFRSLFVSNDGCPSIARIIELGVKHQRVETPLQTSSRLGDEMTNASATPRPRIGFIGLGGMGSRMASRLLGAGYPLAVYDRRRDRTEQLRGQGAEPAESVRALAASVDVVLSSVTDDAAVEAVMYGDSGVLENAGSGTVIVDMSTVRPHTSEIGRAHV